MTTLADALQTLQTAAATVGGLNVYKLGDTVTPPGVIFNVPSLEASTFAPYLIEATFECYLVVALDSYAVDNLLEYAQLLFTALESGTGAVVTSVQPGTFSGDGTNECPAYLFTVVIPI